MTITEITKETVDAFYDGLEEIYSKSDAILCPQRDGLPTIPSREDCQTHLDYGRRLVVATTDDLLTHTLLLAEDKIATCWASKNKQAMGKVQWEFAEYFESIGETWVLDTNTPGWVTRQYFKDYAPGGGPFDVDVWHPGLPHGTTYSDFDDKKWALKIWRLTTDHAWQWAVSVHG